MDSSSPSPVSTLKDTQEGIEILCAHLHKYREGRRAVALAITKLEEARLWLDEAIRTNDGP